MMRLVCFLCLIVISFRAIYAHPQDTQSPPPQVISLDFQEIEIRKVLHLLAKFVGVNILIDEAIQGKMSLHLSNIEPEQALHIILQMQNLMQKRVGNTWVIKQNQSDKTPLEDHLPSQRIALRYRNVKDIVALFEKEKSTHPQSQLTLDERSNSLWIRDTPERIKTLQKIIQSFDQPTQQVLIEARIVSIDRAFEQTIGMRLGLIEPTSTLQTAPIETSPTEPTQQQSSPSPRFNIDLPVASNAPVSLGFPLLLPAQNKFLDLELSAIENTGNGRIISSPRLMTTDRTPALIESGSEIPYQEKTRLGGTSVTFKKAVLSLKVTPHIRSSQQILLKLQVNHDKPSAFRVQETPAIDTRELKTEVLLKPGETVVLGGIYENTRQQNTQGIPWLSQLPVLGYLFSRRTLLEKTNELLIFVTPHIVSTHT